jgi:uncharacterized protein YegL
MIGESIEAVNAGIGELFRTIHGDPVVDAKARVSIIMFSDQASVLLPLTQLSLITQSPGCLRSDNPSSYKAVFRLLKAQIETDVLSLEVEGFRVHRPFVFFMTCGKPVVEDWRYSLKQLTDTQFKFHPNIVSFGVAGADPSVIKEVSTPLTFGVDKQSFAFLAQDGVNPGSALREIMKFITGTIIASARQDQPTMAIDKDQLADMGVLIIDSV